MADMNYIEKQLKLLDEVNTVERRNYPEKTVFVTSLFATHTEEDKQTIKSRAKSLGLYGGKPTSLNGTYALKFSKH